LKFQQLFIGAKNVEIDKNNRKKANVSKTLSKV